jgi:hypothetical protein
MSDNACAAAVSNFPPGPTTAEEFNQLTTKLAATNEKAIQDSLKNMNIGQCSYTNTATNSTAVIVSPLAVGGANVKTSSQTATGCEQVSLQAQMSVALNSNTQCALSSTQSSIASSTFQANQINIQLKNIQTTGKVNLTGEQVNNTAAKVFNFASSDVTSAMTSSMTNTVSSFAKSLQSTSEAISKGALLQNNPTGQKSLSSQVQAVQNLANSTSISKIVSDTISNTVQNNGTTIIVDGLTASELNLDLKQMNVNTYVVQSIAKNVLKAAFGSEIASAVASTAENVQKEEKATGLSPSKEAKSNSGIFGSIIVILLGAAFFGTMASVMPCSYGTVGYYGIIGGGGLFGIGFLLVMIGFIFRKLRATGKKFMIWGIAFMAEAFGFGFLAVKNCVSG